MPARGETGEEMTPASEVPALDQRMTDRTAEKNEV